MPKKITRSAKRRPELNLPLRIVVKSPPTDVLFCVQGRLGEYLSQTRSDGSDLTFDVDVRVAESDPPRLLGNVVQGPPAQRFVYVCSGQMAGDPHTACCRRAKIPLTGITRDMIAQAKPGQRLSASIQGVARDGGPVCASVKLLGSGWRWAR